MNSYLIPTKNAEHLGKKFDSENDGILDDLEVLYLRENNDGDFIFCNGEPYTRFDVDEIEDGSYVAVLHASHPNPETSRRYYEHTLNILRKETNPGQVDLIFTHFPEQMQDSTFNRGEVNSAKETISNLLQLYSDKWDFSSQLLDWEDQRFPFRIAVVNPHFSEKEWTEPYEEEGLLEMIDVSPRFKELIDDRYEKTKFYVGPDDTAMHRFDLDASLEKNRYNTHEVNHDGVWYRNLADMMVDSYDGEFPEIEFSEFKEVLNGERSMESLEPNYIHTIKDVFDDKIWDLVREDKSLDDAIWILMDDTIETGGTQESALKKLRDLGAEDTMLASIHSEDILPVAIYRSMRDYESTRGKLLDFMYDFWKGKFVHEIEEIKEGSVWERDYSLDRQKFGEIFEKYEEEFFDALKRNYRGIDKLIIDNRLWISNSIDHEKIKINLGHPNINDNIVDILPYLKGEFKKGRDKVT